MEIVIAMYIMIKETICIEPFIFAVADKDEAIEGMSVVNRNLYAIPIFGLLTLKFLQSMGARFGIFIDAHETFLKFIALWDTYTEFDLIANFRGTFADIEVASIVVWKCFCR